jgi:transposase, IS30 family
MTYTQLTQEQRYQIYALLKTEQSQTKIATVIGVNKSTISREIRRNCGQRGYRPKQAQRISVERRRNKVTKRITTETWARVDEKLQQDWSPEQVSGWLKKNTDTTVSHEWIYQHIYMDKRSGGNL